MTTREQLYERMSAEYTDFINELKTLPPVEIIENSYAKVFKGDILSCIQDEDFDEEQLKVFLTSKSPLDEIYQNWIHTDITHMDDLKESISEFAAKETERINEIGALPLHEPEESSSRNKQALPTTQVINGELNVGDNVIVAPHDSYGCLIGEVTQIDKLGTPEHDTDNPGDDVHVNFTVFNYPPWQEKDYAEHFAELSGGDFRNFNELPLDDVIIAPDALINLTGINQKKIKRMVSDYGVAEKFCNDVISGLIPTREDLLIQRIEKNYSERNEYLLGFGSQELIDMAGTISAWHEMHNYLTKHHAFDDVEIDYLLQFQTPLEVVADSWVARNEDADEKSSFLFDLCEKRDELYEYPLMSVSEAPVHTAAEKTGDVKPSSPHEHFADSSQADDVPSRTSATQPHSKSENGKLDKKAQKPAKSKIPIGDRLKAAQQRVNAQDTNRAPEGKDKKRTGASLD